MKRMEYITTEEDRSFFPCKTCSNVMTKLCVDECMRALDFHHYHHRPGTDIKALPPFPIEEVLNEPDPHKRLLAVCIYLVTAIDFIQHEEEYQRNREVYAEAPNDNGKPRRNDEGIDRSHLPSREQGPGLSTDRKETDPPHPAIEAEGDHSQTGS